MELTSARKSASLRTGWIRTQPWVFGTGCGGCINQYGSNGVKLSLSTDKVHFQDLLEPMIPVDGDVVDVNSYYEATKYSSLVSDGLQSESNDITGTHAFLAYTIFQASTRATRINTWSCKMSGWKRRHRRTADLMWESRSQTGRWVAMCVQPAAWFPTRTAGRITGSWVRLMTASPSGAPPAQKLEECVSRGNPWDYVVATDGSCCALPDDQVKSCPPRTSLDYRRIRTSGYAYVNPQPGTSPLYRCQLDNSLTHFLTTDPAECVGHGHAPEALLGYLLNTSN